VAVAHQNGKPPPYTMSIVTITWARNEADILETFVRHHISNADRMIIILHRTEDESEIMLRQLICEGLPIDIRTDSSLAYRQSTALTALLEEVLQDDRVDWVLPLDADEFLQTSVENSLQKLCDHLPTDIVTLIPWKTYVPTPSDNSLERNVLKRVSHRCLVEQSQYHKILIPAALVRKNASVIPLGSHHLLNKVTQQKFPEQVTTDLYIAHFPVRSEEQLRRKILLGWKSHSANPDRRPGQIFQWERLYGRCSDPLPIGPEELQNIAYNYIAPIDEQHSVVKLVFDSVDQLRMPNLIFPFCSATYYTPFQKLEEEGISFADYSKQKNYYGQMAEIFDLISPRTTSTESEVDFLLTQAKKYQGDVSSFLDVACGTGRIIRTLAERGYHTKGVDASVSLLEKARAQDANTVYTEGDMRTFEVSGSFHCISCMWEAYPYLSRPEDLSAFLERCFVHLRPNGILVLDSHNFRKPSEPSVVTRTFETDDYQVEVIARRRTLLKEQVHEAVFTSIIQHKHSEESAVIVDQELVRSYGYETVAAFLENQEFALCAVYGDFDGTLYDQQSSLHQIIVAQKT
jgi:2-polyprenyl-3-methyl-5-hydroxy-6-metoxy-1,4-benzoquinol methylase